MDKLNGFTAQVIDGYETAKTGYRCVSLFLLPSMLPSPRTEKLQFSVCAVHPRPCPAPLEGTWLTIASHLNALGVTLVNQTRAIGHVAQAVYLGDLSVELDMPAQGEQLDMKIAVNETVRHLRAVAGAATRISTASNTEEGVRDGLLVADPDLDLRGAWKVGSLPRCTPRIC